MPHPSAEGRTPHPSAYEHQCTGLYPGHGPEDIRRYPGHMTRGTAAVISWVICPGYLLIYLGHVIPVIPGAANHQGR